MISTILQYSTTDIRFLEANLKQTSKFSDEIIIPICTHFFNGEPENQELLQTSLDIISKYPKSKFHIFEWEGKTEHVAYYHNLSRKIGTDLANNDWLLLLDTDEIIEDEFSEWYDSVKDQNKAWVFTCHWYFREPIYRATQKESAGLLVHKKDCNWDLTNRLERQQLYQKIWDRGELVHGDLNPFTGPSGNLLLHHYSWVRSKEQMLKKVQNWGHKDDKAWSQLVEEEFSREFNSTDFVHNYNYEIVDNKFNL